MLDYYDEAGKPRRKTFKNRPDAKPFLQKLQARISKLSSVIDGDELNVTIHRHSDWSNYLKLEPLTIRAIIEIIGKMWLTTATLTDAERGFLRKFAAAKDRGAFIGENFFDAALNCGQTLKTDRYRNEDMDEDTGEIGLHCFFGMYVVRHTQYGEGQDEFGPFAKTEDALHFFYMVNT